MAKQKKPDGTKKNTKAAKPKVIKTPGPAPDFTPRYKRASREELVQAAFEKASKDSKRFADGLLDTYGFKTDEGIVVIDVVNNAGEKPVIFIVESTAPSVRVDNEWFLVHTCLRHEKVRQIASDALFAWQEKVHTFLRPFVSQFYHTPMAMTPIKEKEEVSDPNLTELDRLALKRAQERRLRKALEKKSTSLVDQTSAVALHSMRETAISAKLAAFGRPGYCDLSDDTGECIALFRKEGTDFIISVAFLGDRHVLRLAGVKVNDSVVGGQLVRGSVDHIERQHLPKAVSDIKDALAKYLHTQMELRSVRFVTKTKTTA